MAEYCWLYYEAETQIFKYAESASEFLDYKSDFYRHSVSRFLSTEEKVAEQITPFFSGEISFILCWLFSERFLFAIATQLDII
jgi:hypothetical protein